MPVRAPRLLGCGCVVTPGQRCAHQVVADRERKARFDATRASARERGYDTKWDKERAAYLRVHTTCKRCPAPATVVDHIQPHRGDMKRFWSRSNWQSLCTRCHNSRKQSLEKRGLSCDEVSP